MPGDASNQHELSLLIRHIHLRKLATKIRRELFPLLRDTSGRHLEEQEAVVHRLYSELQDWRATSPVVAVPVNGYETVEFLEINFFRHRMLIFSVLVMSSAASSEKVRYASKYLPICLESAVQIVAAYRALKDMGHITNRTFAHGILQSGFMILFCGVHLLQIFQAGMDSEIESSNFKSITILSAIDTCDGFLKEISNSWKAIKPHCIVFSRLADEVKFVLQATSQRAFGTCLQGDLQDSANFDPENSAFQSDLSFWKTVPSPTLAARFGLSDAELNEVFGLNPGPVDLNWLPGF